MMKRKMMLEIDHMGVKAAGQAMDIFESESYPGVLSSHSWMDLNWTDRVYGLGGFIAQYMHPSKEFVAEAARTDALRTKYDKGYGYGTDFNGIGDHPAPRGTDTGTTVTYPFTSVDGGSVIDRQTTGSRTWDINTDGAAHVGLVPDWIQDIKRVGGADAVSDLFRGAESYLDTWGASETHKAGVNLAKGVTATASSSESNPFTSYQPGRAVDGDSGSRWASDWSDDQWLQLDLGSTNLVKRVTLDWEKAFGKSYRVELSTDGTTWQTAWSTTVGDGGLDTAQFAGVPARYVRVHGLDRGTDWGYSLHEVGVYSS